MATKAPKTTPLGDSPVVARVREARRQLAAQFDYDPHRLGEYLRSQGKKDRHLSAQEFDELTSPEKVTRLGSPPGETTGRRGAEDAES